MIFVTLGRYCFIYGGGMMAMVVAMVTKEVNGDDRDGFWF